MSLNVLNGKSEETVLVGAGPIFSTPMDIVAPSNLSVVRFTIAGDTAAIFTVTGWASFAMELNGGFATKSFAFAIEVRPGMALNIESDRAGTFKVIASEVLGGVI